MHDVPARGALRLRPVLRPARARLRQTPPSAARSRREKIEAGPRTLWRYADLLPVRARRRRPARRLHAADPGAAAWPPRSDCASCTSRSRAPTRPTRSRTASSRWPRPRPSSSASPALACASTGNLAGAVAAQAAALGLRRLHLRARPTWSGRRSSPPPCPARPCSRSTATTTTSTGSAPSSPTTGRGRSSTSTCAPTTRRARRRWRSRRPSSSAGGCPTRSWRRSPPARCYTRCTGYAQPIDVGLVGGRAAAAVRRPGRRAARRWPTAWDRGEHEVRPVRPDTHRQVARHRRPGRRRQRARRRPPHRRRHRGRRRRRDRRGHRPAGPDHRHLHGDRRRRHHRVLRSWPSEGQLDPDARPSPTSPATA